MIHLGSSAGIWTLDLLITGLLPLLYHWSSLNFYFESILIISVIIELLQGPYPKRFKIVWFLKRDFLESEGNRQLVLSKNLANPFWPFKFLQKVLNSYFLEDVKTR